LTPTFEDSGVMLSRKFPERRGDVLEYDADCQSRARGIVLAMRRNTSRKEIGTVWALREE
jgi:hypothetical protein